MSSFVLSRERPCREPRATTVTQSLGKGRRLTQQESAPRTSLETGPAPALLRPHPPPDRPPRLGVHDALWTSRQSLPSKPPSLMAPNSADTWCAALASRSEQAQYRGGGFLPVIKPAPRLTTWQGTPHYAQHNNNNFTHLHPTYTMRYMCNYSFIRTY